ncbi:hypothetical protein ACWD4O_39170 [Streptomyces sp. NPDC002623]
MAKLARAVHVTDPHSGHHLVLQPGEEPAEHLAALITMPSAWEDGHAPDANAPEAKDGHGEPGDATTKADPPAKKTAARKTSAAAKPARGRDAAAEGTSGD